MVYESAMQSNGPSSTLTELFFFSLCLILFVCLFVVCVCVFLVIFSLWFIFPLFLLLTFKGSRGFAINEFLVNATVEIL